MSRTRTMKQRKPRRRRSLRGAATSILAFAVLVIAAGAVAFLYGKWQFERPGPLQEEATVMIERGVGTAEIARRLEEAGAISDSRLFLAAALATERAGRLKAGEYAIPAGASMANVIARLTDGDAIVRKLTVPEGLTSAQIVERVRAAPALTGEIAEVPPEGTLLPETYLFHRGDDRQALIEHMRAEHDALMQALWDKRDPSIAVKTPEEAVILASIVEKETGVPEERPEVATVFHNRLKRHMRLQSDPTIIYGIAGGDGGLGRAITKSDIEAHTKYNTYQIDGLPPTPIANPGRAAIEAVLNPADSDAVYFVADGTGGHVFADTLAEHRRNVRRWRTIERERRREAEAAPAAAREPAEEPDDAADEAAAAEPEAASEEAAAAEEPDVSDEAPAAEPESGEPPADGAGEAPDRTVEPAASSMPQAEIAAPDTPEQSEGEGEDAADAATVADPPTPQPRPETAPDAGAGAETAADDDAADDDDGADEPRRLVLRSVPLPRPKPAPPPQ